MSEKNRKLLVMFSHNTHPFLQSEIIYSSSIFERIIVICPDDEEIRKCIEKLNNVDYHRIKRGISIGKLGQGILISKSQFRKELNEVIAAGKVSKEYFKLYYLYMVYTAIISKEIKNILRTYLPEEIAILSMWFAPTSYAASVIKKAYPQIYVASLAHSFEVDDRKNDYVKYLFKGFCHQTLDMICFISKRVKDEYLEKYIVPNKWRRDNICVHYLGVAKKEFGMCKKSSDNVIRVVSCSYCVPVKRIDLIFNSIQNINNLEVLWTHIGEGETYGSLQELVKNANSNIHCNLIGSMTNADVHRYYIDNPVDVFINLSAAEGIPVTLMEASSYGVPLIATDVGGNSEIVNELNGVLLNENPDSATVAKAIMTVVSSDNNVNYRNRSYEMFQEHFNAAELRPSFYKMLAEQ